MSDLDLTQARIYYQVRGTGRVLLLLPGGDVTPTGLQRISPTPSRW